MDAFIDKHYKKLLFTLSVVITILLGVLTGVILVFQKGFPQIENLEDIDYKVMTVLYDVGGWSIREFAIEKRRLIRRSDIPLVLEKALVASEDMQFYSHFGINFKGTVRAIWGVVSGQNLGGGSSITQQLARNLFLEELMMVRSFSRKFREMLMAVQIERRYTKDQILTAYCNKILLGGRIYGMAAASRYYLGKDIQDITLADAATLVAMVPSPNRKFNVFRNPENCLANRNFILRRMLKMGFIAQSEYEEALQAPLPEEPFESEREELGDYFVEENRKTLERKYGGDRLYTGGLKVHTTLNTQMQRWAESALREGLRALDKRRGWRGGLPNFMDSSGDYPLESISIPAWRKMEPEPGKLIRGVVLSAGDNEAIVKIGPFHGRLAAAETDWTKKKPGDILKTGDVVLCRILKLLKDPERANDGELIFTLGLEQEPQVEGAILVVENKTGKIRALVGGYSFQRSKWNRATQAKRQTGSTIKPIIYAAAIDANFTPASMLMDEPMTYDNRYTDKPYEPQNDSMDFVGPITLRQAFQQSRNIISARLTDYLSPPMIVAYTRKFGITSEIKPTMSIALGAYEVSLKEMVAAFTVFPNLGVRVQPYLIEKILDQNNHILEENYPDRKQVISEETAFIINYMMQGVVQEGTGKAARHLDAPIGGKTGTTNNYTDAWFIGFSPSVTVGVWVGLDQTRSLGEGESGPRAACPIFVRFMETYLEEYGQTEPRSFRKPAGIIMKKIDKLTGKLWTPECLYPFMEAFKRGYEPVSRCSTEEHDKIPYYHLKDE